MPVRLWFVLAAIALPLMAYVDTIWAADPNLDSWLDEGDIASTVVVDDASTFALERDTVVVDCAAGERIIYQPGIDFPMSVGVPVLSSAIQFHASLLYLRPSADNLGYAVLTTEKNFASPFPLAQPYWAVETLKPGYDPAFEVGAGYAIAGSGNDLQVNWQRLRSTTSQAAATTQSDGQWISPFSQTGPSTAETYQELDTDQGVNKFQSADGQVDFDYDAVNLDLGQYVDIGSSLTFRLFGGVGFARLRDQVVSSFHGLPPAPHAVFPESTPLFLSLEQTSTFMGAGPRFGLDATCQTRRGLSFTGQLAGALLIGRTQPAQYLFTATAPELALLGIDVNHEQISSEGFTHVVYSSNAKLGLGYAAPFANGVTFTVEGGYLAAIYINPFSSYETNNNVLALQIGSLSTASVRHTQSNFTADGFYLSSGLEW